MSCRERLLKQLDLAAENFEFPLWECGEESAFVGAMRVSGFTSVDGHALVFESFEHSVKEEVIQSLTFCFATFPIETWVQIGESIQILVNSANIGAFRVLEVNSHNRIYTVDLTSDVLIDKEYLSDDSIELTPTAILLQICDTIPRDWLFSESHYIQKLFHMPDGTHRLFVVESWQHPSFEELYVENIKPSQMSDMVSLVEALCDGEESPKLSGTPNTSWEVQCKD